MKVIRIFNGHDGRSNHYYHDYEIVDKLPKVGDVIYGDDESSKTHIYGERERVKSVSKVSIDFQHDNHDVYDYDFFKVITSYEEYDNQKGIYEEITNIDEEYCTYYYATKRK